MRWGRRAALSGGSWLATSAIRSGCPLTGCLADSAFLRFLAAGGSTLSAAVADDRSFAGACDFETPLARSSIFAPCSHAF